MATRKRRRAPIAALAAIAVLFSGSFGGAEETPARPSENLTTIEVGAPVYGLAFSPRGDLLATAGKNGVRLWAVDTRLETVKLDEGAIPRPEKGWFQSDRSFDSPVFSPDGTLLAAAEYLPWGEGKRQVAGGRYCVWDVASGTLRAKREFEEPLTWLAFSPDGARLAFGDSGHGFGCSEIADGATWHQRGESRMAPPTAAVAFSPDGRRLAVADDPDEGRGYLGAGYHVPIDGADGTIRLIDPTTKKTLRKMSAESSQGLHVLAFAPDGKTLYAAYEDGHLRAWDVGSGELVKSYCIQSEPWYFTPIAMSCDGKWLAAPDRPDGPVVIWDLVAGRKANVIEVSTDPTDSLALSTGALRLAAADPDDDRGTVSLWTAPKGGEADRTAEPPGPGVRFNGATSYAEVADARPFDLEAFTLAAWVKPETHRFSQVLLNRGDAGKLFTLYLHEGKVRMLVEYRPGRYTHANCSQPPTGVWTHLAGSYDGRQIKVYVNGKLEHTVEAPGRIAVSDAPLLIGALMPDARPFHGRLEDIRVWSRALAEPEIALVAAGKNDPTLDHGLVARWTSDRLGDSQWPSLGGSTPLAEYHADGALKVRKADGYRGIWYQCGVQGGPYRYKYSGGLGTYCAKHRPLAVYAEKVNKTFFCYGGTDAENSTLLHMVSYYDHATGTVPRPTILLDKHTTDAHDNPVISIDAEGHLWIFSSAHGTARPAYVSVSKKPYDIEDFERVWVTNFSYPQPYYVAGKGFLLLHTRYGEGRRLYQMSSRDGRTWSEPALLAAINWGHYQVSGRRGSKIGTAFNYHRPHPSDGSHWRTNLYYMETDDFGRSWHNAAGEPVELPLADPQNPALVHDYEKEGLDVYMKDVAFDSDGRPVILYLTSGGNEAGPTNDPRTWWIARWTGSAWEEHDVLVSDNNYDTGSLYVESRSLWRLIGPTEPGPQRYNTGGEVALWTSTDQGTRWNRLKQLTRDSQYNHTYCRRPEGAHPDFYAFWADGHGLEVSPSRLYFTDREGTHVWRLPETIEAETARPEIAW